MDGHDKIMAGIQFLQREDTVTLLELCDPALPDLRAAAEQARATADAAAVEQRQYAQRTAVANEALALRRRNAARAAGELPRGAVDPRHQGTLRAVARTWVISTMC